MVWVPSLTGAGSRPGRWAIPQLRRLFAGASLLGSDAITFSTIYWIFRHHHLTPHVIVFPGRTLSSGAVTIDTYLIYAAAFLLVRLWAGDYTRRTLFWEGARATTHTLALFSFLDVAVSVASHVPIWPSIVASWIVSILVLPIVRQCTRHLVRALGLWDVPAALIGTGPHAVKVYNALKHSLALGFGIRQLINTQPFMPAGGQFDPLVTGTILCESQVAKELVQARIEQVIVVPDGSDPERMSIMLQHLVGTDIRVLVVPQLRGVPLFGLKSTYFFGHDLLLLNARNNLARLPSRIIKRISDFLGAAILITILSPFMACIALAIKRESEGPALFVQERVGRNKTLFRCVKFRTMVIDAEAQLAAWSKQNPDLYDEYIRSNFKLKKDPRVTGVGQWLRRTSLDELPQLFNVLVGSMSLVGPRPLLARELPDYGPGIDLYYRVRPGITGLWQTRGRSDTQFQDRVTFDEWYILNWSFWYDIVILLQTAWIVGTGKGAY